MTKNLYLKMALTNIKSNRRFYLPFLITCIMTTAMFFNMCSLSYNGHMFGNDSIKFILALGSIVIGIFSVIFLFYTNSFLIKRRKKELGLYNILGMEKRHIGRVLLYETLLSAFFSIIIGLMLGLLFDRLMYMILLKVLHSTEYLHYQLQLPSLLVTIIIFAFIFLLILLSNLHQIKKSNPTEMLQSAHAGDREPRTKWLLVLIGIVTLGAGYYIAITTTNVLEALVLFFVAVILVMIGTYCLFTAGSIALLKMLKRNKHYYYQPRHFVSVSGMLYRMKQNAVGLANICILATAVLVMISTTVSLYVGMNDIMKFRYHNEIVITMNDELPQEKENWLAAIDQSCAELQLQPEDMSNYQVLQVTFSQKGSEFTTAEEYRNKLPVAVIDFMTAADYEKLTGKHLELADNEIAVGSSIDSSDADSLGSSCQMFDQNWQIKQLTEPPEITGSMSGFADYQYYFILSDEAVLQQINSAEKEAYSEAASSLETIISFDVSGSDSDALDLYYRLQDNMTVPADYGEGYFWNRLECRQANIESFYEMYGGLFFLGGYLGLLFLMVTVLIIYYKQIIEGYEDRSRFAIMQNVGMDKALVKGSIRSQILTMFFLPLAAAAVHICFAFPLLTRLLRLLSLTNISLFALCTAGTFVVFAVFYALVYVLTSRTYYNLVRCSN